MYSRYYGLKENPFNLIPDPKYFYLSAGHKRALAYLNYGIKAQKGFMVISGEIGSGKTTLIKKLLTDTDNKTRVAWILNPKLTPFQFLQTLIFNFGIKNEINSRLKIYQELLNFLREEYRNQHKTVLIVDEAQNMDINLLEEVRMLSNFENSTGQILQIILLGQPELNAKLNLPQLKQFNQRISVRFHLSALKEEETREYILHRLKVAGSENSPFEEEAIKKIYLTSGGIPRIINIICDAALLSAYAEERREISGAYLEEIVRELNIPGNEKKERGERKNDGQVLAKIQDYEKKLEEISRKLDELHKKQIHGPLVFN